MDGYVDANADADADADAGQNGCVEVTELTGQMCRM